jgi:hypothetical protein
LNSNYNQCWPTRLKVSNPILEQGSIDEGSLLAALSLTPCFSGVLSKIEGQNRFSGFVGPGKNR